MRPRAELGDVDRAVTVDLQEREQRHVEAAALEIGELLRRRHDRLGVGGAAELEIEQRHAADRALFDHPGHRAVPAFLDQDARHVGGYAETDVDGVAVAQFLRDPARDHFGDAERRGLERRERTEDLARDRRIVGRVGGLLLLGRDDDDVDQNSRHDDVVRAQRSGRGEALDLRDHQAAVVANGERLIERAENAAFVLVGKIAALVGGGGADDRDIGRDGRKEQPVLAGELDRARRSARRSPWRSSRSPRARDRRTCPCRPWSARRDVSPPPRDADRTGCPKARCRRGWRRRRSSRQISGGGADEGPEG